MPPRASVSAGAKSRARIYRDADTPCRGGAPALAIVALLSASCTTPAVMARAAWIGSERDEDGSRTLFSYAAGTITKSTLRPLTVDPEADQLSMLVELDPRGRGALVRAVDNGWLHQLGAERGLAAGYLDLTHSRALPLWLPGEADATNFTAFGDALWWFEDCTQALAVVPLAPGLALEREERGGASTVAPLLRGIGSSGLGKPGLRASCVEATRSYGAASAADAAVLFVLAAAPGSMLLRADDGAAIEAVRYPASADEPARLEPVRLGALPAEHHPRRLPELACVGGGPSCGIAAVDPDGEAASIAVTGAGCRLLRWDARTGKSVCAVADDAPPELRTDQLVAAISPDHYVFRDGLTLHRWAWRTGELVSRPLVASLNEAFVRATADGRAVVVGTTGGPLMRADVEGIEILNIARYACPGAQDPVISPSGRFAAWTCVYGQTDQVIGQGGTTDALAAGDVVRVSAAGAERFQGVPMWALAIDDTGDLLLHSRNDAQFNQELLLPGVPPRNLYVLAGDGELARIDGLEPDPELLIGLPGDRYRWIDAKAM